MPLACLLIRLSISHASHVATGKSTRPRGARRDSHRVARGGHAVSIHAPTWGATLVLGQKLPPKIVSIHAPARDATRDEVPLIVVQHVSIHAPARGTTTPMRRLLVEPVFQSTRPRGARLSPNWTNTNYSTKQSYIQAATKLTKITRPAVPQFCCQGTRANIVINQHHLPFARHRARRLAKPQGHKVSSHQNAPPFFANSSRGYIHAGYLLTHQ